MKPKVLQVGLFGLEEEIASGGMSRVWLAHHLLDKKQVALKVLTPENAQDPSQMRAFQFEVRAAAHLQHPSITTLHDHGIISRSEAVKGTLPEGAPWLAMEYLEGGTAEQFIGKLGWKELKRLILSVLDALAHAHARGVIHRDIKLGNLLVDSELTYVKLADFGIALSLQDHGWDDDDHKSILGTPAYMSPEQIKNRWRDFGPWTDLYSLGILIWILCTGNKPYAGSIPEVLASHLTGELPEFQPIIALPDGFSSWLMGLLCVNEKERFQRAADAAWALHRLGEAVGEPQTNYTPLDVHDPTLRTLALPPESLDLRDQKWWIIENQHSKEADLSASMAKQAGLPPQPKDWERISSGEGKNLRMRGVGLNLYGLQNLDLVGRVQERNVLWSALGRIRKEKHVEIVFVEGPSGSGKSALARWLGERAEELGAAQFLSVSYTPSGASSDGFCAMLARHWKVVGLSRRAVIERLSSILKTLGETRWGEAVALAQLLSPSRAGEHFFGYQVQFSGSHERYTQMTRALQLLSEERPLVIWVDDFLYSPEGRHFLNHLLSADLNHSILIVATAGSESLPLFPVHVQWISSLVEHEQVSHMVLEPLEREESAALVRDLLGLEPVLAAEVEERCGGNPLFAIQLVADWVERGILEVKEEGFGIAQGAVAGFPESLLEVWRWRTEEVLVGFSEEAGMALELAAVLGEKVDDDEWSEACHLAGFHKPGALLIELFRLRLAISLNRFSNWCFVHGMLREALEHRAEMAGRRLRWFSICAQVLASRPTAVVRRARYLINAGETKILPEVLRLAIFKERSHGEYVRARILQDLRKQALQQLELPDDATEQIYDDLIDLYLERINQSEYDKSQAERVEIMLKRSEKEHDQLLRSRLMCMRAQILVQLGFLEKAEKTFKLALRKAEQARLHEEVVHIFIRLGYVYLRLGDLKQGCESLRNGILEAEEYGFSVYVSEGYLMLSRIKWQQGLFQEALFLNQESKLRYERHGMRTGLAQVANTLGEILRALGHLEKAEEAYKEAVRRYESIGSPTTYPKLNLAITLAERGHYEEALQGMTAVLNKVEKLDLGIVSAVRAIRLYPLASLKMWSEVTVDVERIFKPLLEGAFTDFDVARFTQKAGRCCLENGYEKEANKLLRLALNQWESLEREEEIHQTRRLLANLSDSD